MSGTNYPVMQHHIAEEVIPILRTAELKKLQLVTYALQIQRKKKG
jgi:hypothetical protein